MINHGYVLSPLKYMSSKSWWMASSFSSFSYRRQFNTHNTANQQFGTRGRKLQVWHRSNSCREPADGSCLCVCLGAGIQSVSDTVSHRRHWSTYYYWWPSVCNDFKRLVITPLGRCHHPPVVLWENPCRLLRLHSSAAARSDPHDSWYRPACTACCLGLSGLNHQGVIALYPTS